MNVYPVIQALDLTRDAFFMFTLLVTAVTTHLLFVCLFVWEFRQLMSCCNKAANRGREKFHSVQKKGGRFMRFCLRNTMLFIVGQANSPISTCI